MKKVFEKVFVIVALCVICMFFTTCDGRDYDYSTTTARGSGDMRMFNKSSNQTEYVSGANTIGINPSTNYLEARNGDVIELSYVPDEDYRNYKFDVVYTLIDGEKVTCTGNNCAYEFTLSGVKPGIYPVRFSAKDKEDEYITITGDGTGYIKVLE